MKQGDFNVLRRSEAERFSGGQFRLAVESLDEARRDRASGPKPVEDQMALQAAGDLLHRLETTPHRFGNPRVEELDRCRRSRVLPKSLKGLAEQVGFDALEVVAGQLGEFGGLALREVLRPLEQAPSRLGEDRITRPPLGSIRIPSGQFSPSAIRATSP